MTSTRGARTRLATWAATITTAAAATGLTLASAATLPITQDVSTTWATTISVTPPPPLSACTVMHQGQPVPGASCEVTGLHYQPTFGPSDSRVLPISVAITHSGAFWPHYFRLDFNFVDTGFPEAWNWSASGVRAEAGAVQFANCNDLPQLRLDTSSVWGPVDTLNFWIYENSNGLTTNENLCA